MQIGVHILADTSLRGTAGSQTAFILGIYNQGMNFPQEIVGEVVHFIPWGGDFFLDVL